MMDNRQFRKLSNIADMSGRSAGLGWTNWVPGWSCRVSQQVDSEQAAVVMRRGREHRIWTLLSVFSCHQLTTNPGLHWALSLYTPWPYTRTLGTIALGTVQQLRHWFLVDLFPDDRQVIIPHWLKQFRIPTHQERITAYCNQYKPALNQSRNVIVGQPLLRCPGHGPSRVLITGWLAGGDSSDITHCSLDIVSRLAALPGTGTGICWEAEEVQQNATLSAHLFV